MSKKLRTVLIMAIVSIPVLLLMLNQPSKTEKLRMQYAELIAKSPYSKTKILKKAELKKIPKQDRPDLAFQQDFLQTLDPNTGRPEPLRLLKILNADKNKGQVFKTNSTLNWESRGPLQVGGRTRALMFDPNDVTAKKVWAGGASGGIWVNNDITDSLSVWQQSNESMANFSISTITSDPVNTQNFYVGTGEGYFNIDAVYGAGIWKSADGGATWNNLASTIDFEFIYDMVVRNEAGVGVVYAIVRDLQDNVNGTEVLRSINGGATFTLASHEPFRDLELGPDNTLWAGDAIGGVWKSTDGTTWTKVYQAGAGSAAGGHTIATPRRVELAVAPSNANNVFVLIADDSALGEIIVTLDGGATWIDAGEPSDAGDSTVPNTDFTRGQAWYDLIAAVHPTRDLELFVGGVNAFKLNAGLEFKKISTWHNQVDATVSFAHADHHAFAFRPGHNDEAIMGTDGGVFYIPNVATVETVTNGIKMRNRGYVVTQFYSAAIDPVNTNGFLAGAQDNGTLYFSGPGIDDTTEFRGGDGGFCFIDQTFKDATDGLYYIVATTGNEYRLHDFSTTPGTFFIPLIDTGNGAFINPADYDDENNSLYSYESNTTSNTTITKIILAADGANQGTQSAGTATKEDIVMAEFGAAISHIRVSPYNVANRTVFLGTGNSQVAKMAADKTITMITPPTLVGSVSCIEVGASDDELLVTASNYGVVSVFYTNDGGATWTEKEGDLPDMPVRWALFNPLNRNEVLLATEVGVWKTLNISASTPAWEKANTGMGNVRVDMLQYRALDNTIVAATHGRGLFTSTNFTLDVKENVLVKNTNIKIFPTVSNGLITVASRVNAQNAKFTAYDLSGKQVFSKSLNLVNGGEQPINLNVKRGIYLISIKTDTFSSSYKIIIK